MWRYDGESGGVGSIIVNGFNVAVATLTVEHNGGVTIVGIAKLVIQDMERISGGNVKFGGGCRKCHYRRRGCCRWRRACGLYVVGRIERRLCWSVSLSVPSLRQVGGKLFARWAIRSISWRISLEGATATLYGDGVGVGW